MIDPLPLATYSFVMSITPGPNNVMLTASGATFGFRRTVPHVFGIGAGLGVQMIAISAGLGTIFTRWPALQVTLQWVGAAYLLYLGWRLLGSSMGEAKGGARPVSFLEAAAFQFLNPKAWIMAITAAALFLPRDMDVLTASGYVTALLVIVNIPCVAVWAAFGSSLRHLITGPARRVVFNGVMALALAGTGVMMVI